MLSTKIINCFLKTRILSQHDVILFGIMVTPSKVKFLKLITSIFILTIKFCTNVQCQLNMNFKFSKIIKLRYEQNLLKHCSLIRKQIQLEPSSYSKTLNIVQNNLSTYFDTSRHSEKDISSL